MLKRIKSNSLKKARILLFLFIGLLAPNFSEAATVTFNDGIELRGDKIYLNGEEFFIFAVGYAPWRPGQWPGKDKVDLALVEEDFRRIKDAGFNAIRTWDALQPEELALAEKFDLKVVQGIWLDPSHDFSDPYFIRDSLDYISKVVQWSKDYKSVLMYLVITEPKQDALLFAEEKKVLEFFKNIKQTIKNVDNKPVSMDSWIPLGFLDHSVWDVVTFNAFMFVPESINKSMGFDEYLVWIKENQAKGKPLFIGETGGFSVSKEKNNDIGFGGNTQEEQAKGDIESLKKCISAGVAGVTSVSWIDTWHYPSEPRIHGEDPWEWDGIIEFRNLEDTIGTPREVFYSLKKFSNELRHLLDSAKILHKDREAYKIRLVRHSAGLRIGKIIFEVRDTSGRPVRDAAVDIGLFLPVGWYEEMHKKRTDKDGRFIVTSNLIPEPKEQYLLISLGISGRNNDSKSGDLIFLKLDYSKEPNNKKFYTYRDEDSYLNHFYPTGWTGDYEDLAMDDAFPNNLFQGQSCIKIAYSAVKSLGGGWAGIYWQYPPFNWDEGERAINLSGNRSFVFWAKGLVGGEVIEEIGFGGNSPNSTKVKIGPIILGKEWKKYSINVEKEDLSKIISGFYLFVTKKSNPNGCEFFLDEISFSQD